MNKRTSIGAISSYFLVVVLINGIDIPLGREISFWIPLLAPIALSTWNHGRAVGLVVTVFAMVGLFIVYFLSDGPPRPASALAISITSKAIASAVIVWLIDEIRRNKISKVENQLVSKNQLEQ